MIDKFKKSQMFICTSLYRSWFIIIYLGLKLQQSMITYNNNYLVINVVNN